MSFPGDEALETIYASILNQHLLSDIAGQEFGTELKRIHVAKELVGCALSLQQRITINFLPTAVKFHYTFNLRDLSNIFQVIALKYRL